MAENVNKLKKYKNHWHKKNPTKANELVHPNRCCQFKCKVFLKERTHCCQSSQSVQHVNAINCLSILVHQPMFCYFLSSRGLAPGRIRPLEKSTISHRLRHGTSSLEKWRGESVSGGGGIILALAPAYSPFASAYFGVLRCSCEFSRERVKWKHSQVSGGLFLALPGSITNTTAYLICLFCL